MPKRACVLFASAGDVFAYGGYRFGGEAFEHVRVVAGQDEDADAVLEGHLGQCFRCLLVREDVEQAGDLAGVAAPRPGAAVHDRGSPLPAASLQSLPPSAPTCCLA